MCGRYVLKEPLDLLQRLFAYSSSEIRQLRPRYNIAPTTKIPVVRCGPDGKRELVEMRWGLIPAWAKDPKTLPPMINARSESIASKPSFRTAYKSRRCLIPASGYYEWQKRGAGPKQPFYFHASNDAPFAFAGLWEYWRPPEGEPVISTAMVTRAANAEFSSIHDRMPVAFLGAVEWDRWLGEEPLADDTASELLQSPREGALAARPISTRVNNVRNDEPSLVEE
jgi:putative SOS response-associated peptidase YedK